MIVTYRKRTIKPSTVPCGSFRGRQVEKWGLFQGWDHFGVGIISGQHDSVLSFYENP